MKIENKVDVGFYISGISLIASRLGEIAFESPAWVSPSLLVVWIGFATAFFASLRKSMNETNALIKQNNEDRAMLDYYYENYRKRED